MARVTVEKCLEKFDNRFDMVLAASKRARQLLEGGTPMVDREGDEPTIISLREIEAAHVTKRILDEEELSEMEKDMLDEFSAANLKQRETPITPWSKPVIDTEEEEEEENPKGAVSTAGSAQTPSAGTDAPPASSAPEETSGTPQETSLDNTKSPVLAQQQEG